LAIVARLLVLIVMLASLPAADAETIRVEVNKLIFAPIEIKAQVGDTIEWVNSDFVAHTATAKDESFDVMLEPGKAGRYTLKRGGAVDYYCRFHPNMTGRIAVAR
jgi:plastocyanin